LIRRTLRQRFRPAGIRLAPISFLEPVRGEDGLRVPVALFHRDARDSKLFPVSRLLPFPVSSRTWKLNEKRTAPGFEAGGGFDFMLCQH